MLDDSNSLVTMLDKTGRSAKTAVVITALLSLTVLLAPVDKVGVPLFVLADPVPLPELETVELEDNPPPVTGFNPRIQIKCWRV